MTGIPWLPIGLGLTAFWFFKKRAAAAEPTLALPAPFKDQVIPGSDGLTYGDAANRMSGVLHDQLAAKGFGTYPSYVKEDSATEQIVDVTPGRNRNLVAENQTMTDTFLGFMWDYNAITQFGNFEPANWGRFVERFDIVSAWIDTL